MVVCGVRLLPRAFDVDVLDWGNLRLDEVRGDKYMVT